MICQKCKDDFPESEIQVSHDIPKYLGGTDKDGRHNLTCIIENWQRSFMVDCCYTFLLLFMTFYTQVYKEKRND